jgi:NAD(P)-dependent dehydrogenase (short-subunit alcohol dehydrogenase family)
MHFTDKIVVITGGSKGFGKGLAKAFTEAGAKVVVASHEETALTETAKELRADSFVCDVTSYDHVKALADYAVKQHGRIDVWINNAGVQIAPSAVEDVDLTKLHNLFDINFFGYFYGCKAVLPLLKKQGSGTIIHINSTAGLDGKPGLSAYVSSKFAVKGLTLSLREEVKGTAIQVYGIHPGGIQTEIYKEKYPADFTEYMDVDYAVQKVMENFATEQPEMDLIIRRPAK